MTPDSLTYQRKIGVRSGGICSALADPCMLRHHKLAAMLLPTSGEQIRKLGVRLSTDDPISPEDDQLLEELVACHLRALELARPRLDGLPEAVGTPPLHITARAKTTGTIIEKLRRERGMSLARMRDIAGFRIVGAFSFAAQGRLYAEIAQRFPANPREPKRVDRRAEPKHGYRALHAEVTFDGVHIEIQIRYGEPPTPPPGSTQETADSIVRLMQQFSDLWADSEWLPGEDHDVGIDAAAMREIVKFSLGDVDLGL